MHAPSLLSATPDGPRTGPLGAVWTPGLATVAWKTLSPQRARRAAVAVGVAATWLALLVLAPSAALPPTAVRFLLAGGICYSIGVGFYLPARRGDGQLNRRARGKGRLRVWPTTSSVLRRLMWVH
jgi:channel protein (hemolysin III family)